MVGAAVSTELQVKSTRSDFYSEASSAPVVTAALQQRLICALTGARPSAMLRRGDNGDGSTELQVKSTSNSAPIVAAALQQRLICSLTGARPSAMLRRGDDGDGSTMR